MATEPDTPRRELDVRDIDQPFDDIVTELDRLPEDGTLVLVSQFEPTPLYGVLDSRGFTHEATQVADDEWSIRIEHR